jgi:hypothetical protein
MTSKRDSLKQFAANNNYGTITFGSMTLHIFKHEERIETKLDTKSFFCRTKNVVFLMCVRRNFAAEDGFELIIIIR